MSIVKNKTGYTSDVNNNRSIALVTIASNNLKMLYLIFCKLLWEHVTINLILKKHTPLNIVFLCWNMLLIIIAASTVRCIHVFSMRQYVLTRLITGLVYAATTRYSSMWAHRSPPCAKVDADGGTRWGTRLNTVEHVQGTLPSIHASQEFWACSKLWPCADGRRQKVRAW